MFIVILIDRTDSVIDRLGATKAIDHGGIIVLFV
jgi:hypothetical protein